MLFNDSVRSRQHIRRNRQADLLRGFQIDYELELRRLLYGEICGFNAFENFIHIRSGAVEQVGKVRAVRHKPAGFHKLAVVVHRGEPLLYRKFYNPCSLSTENCAR
jgi:hypothetical protein